jgi:hypothetical protein
MNDDFLYKYRKPPRREFSAALYQRISKPMQTPTRKPILRSIALTLSMVAMITAILFFSPTTRALADTLIRQIGGYIFVQGRPSESDIANKMKLAEQELAARADKKAITQADKQQLNEQAKKAEQARNETAGLFARDAAAASQLAGFSVLAPAYVPAGYTLGSIKNISGGWAVFQQDGGMAASVSYMIPNTKSFLTIEQLKVQPGQSRTYTRPEIVDTTVHGLPGVWMPEDGGKNALVWEENGVTYSVVANSLSINEILRVAESLGK